MGAGLSQAQVSSRVRRRLHAIAAEHGGEYVPAAAGAAAQARGSTQDGIEWQASFGVARASNGEVFGILTYTVRSEGVQRVSSGMFGNLGSALDTFRAERDGRLAYVVARGGHAGARLAVSEDAISHDLGRARWAQQQTGNVADLWMARLDEDGTVALIREFSYTDAVGHRAMHAYMEANGLDIYDAQRTLETRPALAVVDARATAPEPSPGPGMRI